MAGASALGGFATASAQTRAPASAGTAEADAEFRAFVERLAARTRIARPFLIRQFSADRLTSQGRILYETILPGAEADAALSRSDWGDFGSPYAVTNRNGNYRRASELNPNDVLAIAIREVNRDTARLAADEGRGVIAPNFAIEAALRDLDAAIARVTAAGPDKQQLAEAITAQREALSAQLPRAPSEPGLWRLPGGEDYYAQTLKISLGATVDPREAHQRALARCRALQREADTLLRAQGLSSGSVGERLRTLMRDPRYLESVDDAGATRTLLSMGGNLSRVRSHLGDVIAGGASHQETPAEIGRLARAQENNGTAGRRAGQSYLIDLAVPRASWTLPSVVHHELIPGHVLQSYFERRAQPLLELQVRYAGAYSEGWAIYAEQLADEIGAFESDPLGRIGYLQWMLFRYGRIVADTGIHVMRWNRQRAIDELRALQGDSVAFVTIEDDVTRLAVQPGFYAAQGLMAMHIAELRESTRRNARNFTMLRFHEAMLRHGPLSPPGLTQSARGEFAA